MGFFLGGRPAAGRKRGVLREMTAPISCLCWSPHANIHDSWARKTRVTNAAEPRQASQVTGPVAPTDVGGAYQDNPGMLSPSRRTVLEAVNWCFPGAAPCHTPTGRLLHYVTSPAVAVRPERALRADLSFGVVDPLLMRAAYDPIRHDYRFGSMIPHELEDLATNGRICPNVALLGEPTFQGDRLGVLSGHNPNCDFAGAFVIRPVERDGRDRIAPKATTCLSLQG